MGKLKTGSIWIPVGVSYALRRSCRVVRPYAMSSISSVPAVPVIASFCAIDVKIAAIISVGFKLFVLVLLSKMTPDLGKSYMNTKIPLFQGVFLYY
jgi:hypothetical protein